MRSLASMIGVVAVLAGCAVQKDWVPISGSRADGTVKLAFEYGGFEEPQVNREQAISEATKRCSAWGYTAAEPFGGTMRHCTAWNAYGCISYRVEATFQCTGQPSGSRN